MRAFFLHHIYQDFVVCAFYTYTMHVLFCCLNQGDNLYDPLTRIKANSVCVWRKISH